MKKLSELSFLNILFCIIVIFIHVVSEPVSSLTAESALYMPSLVSWRLSAFVVQGFIFLSGLKMFLKKNENFSYKKYYVSRFKKIVVPYVIFVCIFYLYFLKNGYFEFSLCELAKYILSGDLVSHFYFVIVIVQFYLLRPLWRYMLDKISPFAAGCTSLMITVLFGQYFPDIINFVFGKNFGYNDRLFTTYLFYWVMGCYAGENYKSFCNEIMKNKYIISVLFVLFAAADAAVSYIRFSGGEAIIWLENLHIIYSVLAILFWSVISLYIGKYIMKLSAFGIIDKSSYYIYLIHPLFIFIVNGIMKKIGIAGVGKAFLVRSASVYICSFALCGAYTVIRGSLISHIKKRR